MPIGVPEVSTARHLGQQVDIQAVGKEHSLPRLDSLELLPDAGHALDTLRIVVFGHKFAPLPDSADLVAPMPRRFSRDLGAPHSLEGHRQRCATATCRHQP